MSHSPEPWSIGKGNCDHSGGYSISDGNKAEICCDATDINHHMNAEDAARVVACVNACRGIPTQHLEDRECTLICVPRTFAQNVAFHIRTAIERSHP